MGLVKNNANLIFYPQNFYIPKNYCIFVPDLKKSIIMNVEVIFLGPRKQPSYCHDDRGFEEARWYKICYGGSHQVGDGFPALQWYQEAFMCPKQMEVYGGHSFETIDGVILDKNLVEMEDWINENCQGMTEIYDEDEEDFDDY